MQTLIEMIQLKIQREKERKQREKQLSLKEKISIIKKDRMSNEQLEGMVYRSINDKASIFEMGININLFRDAAKRLE